MPVSEADEETLSRDEETLSCDEEVGLFPEFSNAKPEPGTASEAQPWMLL